MSTTIVETVRVRCSRCFGRGQSCVKDLAVALAGRLSPCAGGDVSRSFCKDGEAIGVAQRRHRLAAGRDQLTQNERHVHTRI